MGKKETTFDQNTLEYDRWFEKHPWVYRSEILAIQQALPKDKSGIEIGVGTGRFAETLHIKFGVEPSANMARMAKKRGVHIYTAYSENLPIENESFDFALMVTTVCFISDIPRAFSEVHRILRPKGEIIVAIIDKNSALGKKYQAGQSSSKFYKEAHFHSTEEITELLKQSGFHDFDYWQTLAKPDENEIEKPIKGYGQGSFVVIKAVI